MDIVDFAKHYFDWERAPPGCGLYKINDGEEVIEIYPAIPATQLLSPISESREYFAFATCLGREPYR